MVEEKGECITIHYIRHGYSEFNEYRERCLAQPDKYEYKKFSPELVDPALHSKGIQQAIGARSDIASLNIKYIFVSPLRRALQTCTELFKEHPNLHNMKFIVHPLLIEILNNANDLPANIAKTIKEFEGAPMNYDFNIFKGMERPELYYLYNLNNPPKDKLVEEIKEGKAEGEFDDINIVLKAAVKNAPLPLETYFNVKNRLLQFFQYLREYIVENNIEEKEVAIVGHSMQLGIYISTETTPEGKPIYPDIPNLSTTILLIPNNI